MKSGEKHDIKMCIYYICYVISTMRIFKVHVYRKRHTRIHSCVSSHFLKVVRFQVIFHVYSFSTFSTNNIDCWNNF